MTLRIEHRESDPRRPWYVRCDDCDYGDIGEQSWAEDVDGTDCPACTDPVDLEQLELVEIAPGEWTWHGRS